MKVGKGMQKNWGRNGVRWSNARGRKKKSRIYGKIWSVSLLGKGNNTRNPETEMSLTFSEAIKSSNVI